MACLTTSLRRAQRAAFQNPTSAEANIKHTHIGAAPIDLGGSDLYDRFDFNEPNDPDMARRAAERLHYREGNGHGTRFCTDFSVLPVPYTDGCSYIVIAKQRYDI